MHRPRGIRIRFGVCVEHVCRDPVGEDVTEVERRSSLRQKVVDAGRAVTLHARDLAERRIATEAAGEIAEERCARSVVWRAALGIEGVELRRRLCGEAVDE